MGVDRQRVKAMDPSHFFAPSAVKQSPSLQKKDWFIVNAAWQPVQERKKVEDKGTENRGQGAPLPRIWAEAAHWPDSHTDTLHVQSKKKEKKKKKKTLHMWPWVMAFHQTPNKCQFTSSSDGRRLQSAPSPIYSWISCQPQYLNGHIVQISTSSMSGHDIIESKRWDEVHAGIQSTWCIKIFFPLLKPSHWP